MKESVEDLLAADLAFAGGVVALPLQGGTELVGGLDDLADFRREREERDDLFPGGLPLAFDGVRSADLGVGPGVQGFPGGLFEGRAVESLPNRNAQKGVSSIKPRSLSVYSETDSTCTGGGTSPARAAAQALKSDSVSRPTSPQHTAASQYWPRSPILNPTTHVACERASSATRGSDSDDDGCSSTSTSRMIAGVTLTPSWIVMRLDKRRSILSRWERR